MAGKATVVTVPSTNTAPEPRIDPIKIQRARGITTSSLAYRDD
jgi:hypothetical protein